MLRISNPELRLVSKGYHFDENGKKFVRVFASLNLIKIQIKIQAHKEMHIRSISVDFPYTITDSWVEIVFLYEDISGRSIKDYIDQRCKEVWFV